MYSFIEPSREEYRCPFPLFVKPVTTTLARPWSPPVHAATMSNFLNKCCVTWRERVRAGIACMETPEIGLETFAGAFRFLTCLEAVPYCPSALIITPRPPDLIFNLSGIPDEPIFLAWFRLPSLRRRSAVFRKERQNLLRTAGVIHNLGFTHGSQDMFDVLLPLMHICLSHLCPTGTPICHFPRLRCYSYVCSSSTSLPI